MNPKDYMDMLLYAGWRNIGGDYNHAHVETWVNHVTDNVRRMGYDRNDSHVWEYNAIQDRKKRQERHDYRMKNDPVYRRGMLDDESIDCFQAFMDYT